MKGTKVVIVHPGTQHALKLAKELSKRQYLDKYISTLVWSDTNYLIRVIKKLSPELYLQLSNRVLHEVPGKELKTFPFIELQHRISRFFRGKLTDNELYFKKNKRFQQALKSKQIADADIVIGFDTSSWILVDRAKKNGEEIYIRSIHWSFS